MRETKLKYTSIAVVAVVVVAVAASALVRLYVGGQEPAKEQSPGAKLFREKGCVQCHLTDKREPLAGPGLKDILQREKLPSSGRAATRENVRRQLNNPIDRMPSYKDRLSEGEMRLLLDYLAGL
jgi:mono/diheme cytochrome c family protein